MCSNLSNEKQRISLENYTLKDMALYFERYHGYTCKIETESQYIKFKIDKSSFPHLIGMQYAFNSRKDKNLYKGDSGFSLVKNGKVTLSTLRKAIKNNPNAKVAWKNIKNRIEYLPMFFNTIERKSRLKILVQEDICRNTKLKGQNILFKTVKGDRCIVFPCLVLKMIANQRIVVETFIVESDISLLGNLKEESIKSIELIAPLENTSPLSFISRKNDSSDGDEPPTSGLVAVGSGQANK